MIKKLFLAIFLVSISAAATKAQINPEKAVMTARDQFSDIKNRSLELERMKRESSKRSSDEDMTLNFPRIKEDFEEIQKINSSIFRLISTQTPARDATVFKLVSELKARAVRLKSHLFADKSDAKKEAKNKRQIVEQQNLKTLFEALDESINSFVHNPIFHNINIVNSKDSLKAQKDLEIVIDISDAIRAVAKN